MCPVVLKAVDALSQGGWLALIEVARHRPGAERAAAPLKAADRLMRSPVLTRERGSLYQAMAQWLIREARPLIVVDWSDLKADGSFNLLGAGLAVQGRTLMLWEEVHPQKTAGSVVVERAFLQHPAHAFRTDAGPSCSPMQASAALGSEQCWSMDGITWGGCVEPPSCNRRRWGPSTIPNGSSCTTMHEQAFVSWRDMGAYRLAFRDPLSMHLALHRESRQHRRALTAKGQRRRDRPVRMQHVRRKDLGY